MERTDRHGPQLPPTREHPDTRASVPATMRCTVIGIRLAAAATAPAIDSAVSAALDRP